MYRGRAVTGFALSDDQSLRAGYLVRAWTGSN